MKRGSSKPCPGCGKIESWRPADEVCRECKQALKKIKDWEEQISKIGNDQIVVSFGLRDYWNQYIHDHVNHDVTDDHIGRNIVSAFHRLALAASTPSLEYHAEFELLGEAQGKQYVIMQRSIAEAIRDLFALMQPSIEAIYKSGKLDGHNLLMRLATGDLAPNEFMDVTEGKGN